MHLSDIVRADARFIEESSVVIDTEALHSFVAIELPDGQDIALQGDEADEFLSQARALYEKTGDCTEEQCIASVARPYVENLS